MCLFSSKEKDEAFEDVWFCPFCGGHKITLVRLPPSAYKFKLLQRVSDMKTVDYFCDKGANRASAFMFAKSVNEAINKSIKFKKCP